MFSCSGMPISFVTPWTIAHQSPLSKELCSLQLHGYSSQDSSIHGISQARILEWAAISFSTGSSQHRDRTYSPALTGWFFTTEPLGKLPARLYSLQNISGRISSCFFQFLSASDIPWFAAASVQFSSVQFSHSVVSDSLRPHEPQHARPPCPSPTHGVYPNSCPSSQ